MPTVANYSVEPGYCRVPESSWIRLLEFVRLSRLTRLGLARGSGPPRRTDAAPTPPGPPQLIVRVRQADGTVRRVAFDDCGPSLDDLRAESGADELFADEACTQHAVQEDLKHGAIVCARHNDAMADEEEG